MRGALLAGRLHKRSKPVMATLNSQLNGRQPCLYMFTKANTGSRASPVLEFGVPTSSGTRMASQALVSRMSRELKMLQTDPPPGVWAGPKGDSITALEAQIQGPIGTVYDGGVFSLEVNIPARYPFEPPKVRFVTRVYHPNIDGEGRICLDLLNMPPKGAWKPSLNISTVLASIGLLLSDPNPDDGLVADITQEFKHQRQVFDAKARQLTQRYAVHRDGSDHAGSGSDTTAVPGNGGIGGAEEGQERQHDQAMDATAAARVATEGASAWEAVGQQQEHQHEQQQQQGHNDPIRQHMGQCLNEHGQATAARQPDENSGALANQAGGPPGGVSAGLGEAQKVCFQAGPAESSVVGHIKAPAPAKRPRLTLRK